MLKNKSLKLIAKKLNISVNEIFITKETVLPKMKVYNAILIIRNVKYFCNIDYQLNEFMLTPSNPIIN